jgi:hypothetical protein
VGGTFTDLQKAVDGIPEGGTLALSQDYQCTSEDTAAVVGGSGILVRKGISIDGQGHFVSGNGFCRVLTIQDVSGDKRATFRNLTIRDGGLVVQGAGIFVGESSNVSFDKCVITKNRTIKGTHTKDGGAGGFIDCKARVSFRDCSVVENVGADRTGGLYLKGNVVLENSLVLNNSAGSRGGGLYVDPGYQAPKRGGDWGGNLVMKNCTVSGNSGNRGGGVYVNSENDKLNLFENCTIYSNDVASAASDGNGGGFVFYNAKAKLVNCTVTNNAGKNGGGILVDVSSDVVMANCTVAGNRGVRGGGGVYAFDGSHTNDTMKPVGVGHLFGCLVLGNVSGTAASGDTPDDINIHYSTNTDKDPSPDLGPWVPRFDGDLKSSGYNLIGTIVSGDATWFKASGDRTGLSMDKVLVCVNGSVDLKDNGGPVKTVAPVPGGPAVGIIPAGTAGMPSADARGIARPQGARGDAGAVELAVSSEPASSSSSGCGALGLLPFGLIVLAPGAFLLRGVRRRG